MAAERGDRTQAMSTIGVISDVHGNIEALAAVLAFLRARDVERVVCLGDVVGYNPDGDACVEVLEREGIDTVAGNHDLIALGRLGFERCSDRPAFTLRRTRRDLCDASRAFLASLPPRRIYDGDVVLIHGGVDDVQQYISTPARVEENYARLRARHLGARVCFFGHTHEQCVYEVHCGKATQRASVGEVLLDGRGRTFFVNPGSVDASRKQPPRMAECALFDSRTRTVSFHRVPYDDQLVERRARARGYRMNRLDEWLYRTMRMARRGPEAAMRRARAVLKATEGLTTP